MSKNDWKPTDDMLQECASFQRFMFATCIESGWDPLQFMRTMLVFIYGRGEHLNFIEYFDLLRNMNPNGIIDEDSDIDLSTIITKKGE